MKLFGLVSCVLLAAADPCQEDHAITSEEGLSLIRDCWTLVGSVDLDLKGTAVLSLPALESAANLTISGADLKEIRLPSLIEADKLKIKGVPALTTLDVSELRHIGSFDLAGAKQIHTLSFGAGLTICDEISVVDTSLEAMSGFQARNVTRFVLKGNAALTAVSLDRLESVVEWSVSDSPGLLLAAPRLEKVRDLVFTGAPHLDLPALSITNLILQGVQVSSLTLPFTSVHGQVVVQGKNHLASLSLPNLVSVRRDLTLVGIDLLTSLNLQSLAHVGGRVLINAPKLESLDLSSLKGVDAITIYADQLKALRLEALPTASSVRIEAAQLTAISLSSLKSAGSIAIKAHQLTSLDLGSLARVRIYFQIAADQLPTLDLSSLTYAAGGMAIKAKQLESLDLSALQYACRSLDFHADKLRAACFSSVLEAHKPITFSSLECRFTKVDKTGVSEPRDCSELGALSPVVKTRSLC